MISNLILTGATGFVGLNLSSYLDRKDFNIIHVSRQSGLRFDSLTTKLLKEKNISSIVHLAGKAHDLKNVEDPLLYYKANYELTKTLFDLFIKSEVSKFIFISSVKASADFVDKSLTETDVPNPQTHYGRSKLMAEEYIRSRQLPSGKSFYILRPCMIHGPGNKGNLNLLYKLISKGIPYPLVAFKNERSFLSVENLCFVIRELLSRDDIPSGVYNIADDETISTNKLIKLIAKAIDRKPKLWKINPILIKSLGKLGDILKLPLNTERLNKLTENYMVDNSKIKGALGKEFPIRADEGIIKTIKSFKEVIQN
ncbi:MAG: nucleoside-diphosphate-sugar epimerase [Sphingobacteriales bacterium 17-39-43]|uniref:NAD-dependent epimerase/dehydratase family protein n=1 Tax=Daejeonella sp. TaxID=2805397 RepID=UPI000BC52AAE|nr:NAD-dependent epimerase/dehydratase family protein [Daejeonella sp.]OYZ30209.1 MAG: nucleoside-diphosphate-sugar epimerase [Sphingobacteriales bacterium 16-39-50]OZA22952.1 MAG: nucleoside-diphosphate-sugar epimerase [Sphingobacteriales bacterium 17-39-43]HQT24154.1 NAD-dependent epimerase/dehydratase family protein [Daejeonella sp.]HQT58764.1 NAD-dependent epimerase/dehydratase family protein [Daejeonella sp.]